MDALDICFKDQPLTYSIVGKNILIIDVKGSNSVDVLKNERPFALPPIEVRGVIADEYGNPLVGANIRIKGTNIGTVTKGDGSFVLKGVDENAELEISYVGFETQTVSIKIIPTLFFH
ncbi:carboxypeptidase-like regulatory domain-containing protein [Paraflavitalea speifideaquila]|uniref:carboxypeptidase-like regulatory domain-containing protein n=1 Tax=Paraflavitalea speifideaquila TaxID=3076558 RepID=UPI0028EF3EC5|nr:carboxypeptidase-like regulatory domain-containing protein [Paraflavitalea speifideiaquila]